MNFVDFFQTVEIHRYMKTVEQSMVGRLGDGWARGDILALTTQPEFFSLTFHSLDCDLEEDLVGNQDNWQLHDYNRIESTDYNVILCAYFY